MKNHRNIDERSLAMHRRIAEKLGENPRLMQKAHANLQRWLETCSPGVRLTLLEWQALMQWPLAELLIFLTSSDERATRLRQSSPFCGILTEAERLATLREFQARESAAA